MSVMRRPCLSVTVKTTFTSLVPILKRGISSDAGSLSAAAGAAVETAWGAGRCPGTGAVADGVAGPGAEAAGGVAGCVEVVWAGVAWEVLCAAAGCSDGDEPACAPAPTQAIGSPVASARRNVHRAAEALVKKPLIATSLYPQSILRGSLNPLASGAAILRLCRAGWASAGSLATVCSKKVRAGLPLISAGRRNSRSSRRSCLRTECRTVHRARPSC